MTGTPYKYPFPTIDITVLSTVHRNLIAIHLMNAGAFYVLEPLPDDQWKFTIKPEQRSPVLEVLANDSKKPSMTMMAVVDAESYTVDVALFDGRTYKLGMDQIEPGVHEGRDGTDDPYNMLVCRDLLDAFTDVDFTNFCNGVDQQLQTYEGLVDYATAGKVTIEEINAHLDTIESKRADNLPIRTLREAIICMCAVHGDETEEQIDDIIASREEDEE